MNNVEKILLNVSPVQTKTYSGFFRLSINTIPYTLIVTEKDLLLKFLGITLKTIHLNDITGFRQVGDEWVVTQKIFNGIVIKHRKGNKIKERVISFFDKEKSLELLKLLRKLLKGK